MGRKGVILDSFLVLVSVMLAMSLFVQISFFGKLMSEHLVMAHDVALFIQAVSELSPYLSSISSTTIVIAFLVWFLTKKRHLLQKQRSELELRQFKYAVDNAYDHIVITDPNGVIVYANKAAATTTGYEVSEMVGKKAGSKELWGGQMDQEYYQKMWQAIKIEKRQFSGEITNRRKDGSLYIAESHVSPILDNAGKILLFIGIERDVTKSKQIDRMKTEFISLASHQLRTPLTAIKWHLEMLIDGDAGPLNDEQRKFVDNVNKSNERMIELVNALLNISRIESGRIMVEPTPSHLDKLLQEVLDELNPLIQEAGVEVITSINPHLPIINVDCKLIHNVYQNLLTNSIKYSKKDSQIHIFLSHKDGEIITQIADQGVGIPLSQQTKVFERFFRADNVRKLVADGNGLGLYLVKAIVESSGGHIWFESKEGEGTTFWFSLPESGMIPKKGEVALDN